MVTKKVAAKPQKPELNLAQKVFASNWPETLMVILHVMHVVGVQVRPVMAPDYGFILEESYNGQLDKADLPNLVDFLPARFTTAHRDLEWDYTALLEACNEYIQREEARRQKEEKRVKVLRELSDEQLEALGLTRPR